MTLLKTVMVRDHEGVLRKRAEYWRIPALLTSGSETPIYHTLGAKAVFFYSNAALEVRVPTINEDGTPNDVADLSVEVSSNAGVMVDSASNKVGHIAGNAMPPFIILRTSGQTTNALGAVYITF